MFKKFKALKLSIKARILGILIIVLLLCLLGHLGIFYYTTLNVKKITQNAITEIYNFENEANQELKDSVVNKFILMDVQSYSAHIDKKIKQKIDSIEQEESEEIFGEVVHETIARIFDMKQLLEVEQHKPGYVYIINKQGKVIATEGSTDNPFIEKHVKEGQQLLDSKSPALAKATGKIITSSMNTGVVKSSFNEEIIFFLFSRIESIDYNVVAIVPGTYLNSQVQIIEGRINDYIKTIRANFISFYNKINYITLFVFVVIIFIAYLIGSSLSKTFTTPLVQLKEATEYIGRGSLVGNIDIRTGDEIEELADNFNLMTTDLKNYIEKLRESISREKAIEEEIRIAADIQKSSLPPVIPDFDSKQEIDLSAFIQPTKIVSGDFYDYFFIDDKHLFFALGDVSGKSISAALFMMTTKLLMKKFALMNLGPDEVLKNVNDTLALDNPTCMYSTVFCGVLNIETGDLSYCNGGHTT
ncbi:MAG: SpoIIE family protein phosphatase, partial [Bacteroidota bacterium]